MKKQILLLCALFLFSSHDMYLKPDPFFLQPNTKATIYLYNGTFEKSENVIARNRMADVSLVGHGKRTAVDSAAWSERDQMTVLNFQTGEEGTWVAGVSTLPRNIEMSASDFNGYLEHDGVLDMLEWRRDNDALGKDAVEKYSKHVKTIFQVGEHTSEDWKTELGYPIEFVPRENPYDLHPGHTLEVQLLWEGKPLPNQLVYAGTTTGVHSHDAETEHSHTPGGEHVQDAGDNPEEEGHSHSLVNQLRTDSEGIVKVNLTTEGTWYLRTIYMKASEEPGLTHESNWATLTFAVGQGHSHTHEGVTHAHEEATGIPSYVYWIGSLLLLAGLFFWFKRRG